MGKEVMSLRLPGGSDTLVEPCRKVEGSQAERVCNLKQLDAQEELREMTVAGV